MSRGSGGREDEPVLAQYLDPASGVALYVESILGPVHTKDARCVVLQKALSKAQNEARAGPRRGFATLRALPCAPMTAFALASLVLTGLGRDLLVLVGGGVGKHCINGLKHLVRQHYD